MGHHLNFVGLSYGRFSSSVTSLSVVRIRWIWTIAFFLISMIDTRPLLSATPSWIQVGETNAEYVYIDRQSLTTVSDEAVAVVLYDLKSNQMGILSRLFSVGILCADHRFRLISGAMYDQSMGLGDQYNVSVDPNHWGMITTNSVESIWFNHICNADRSGRW
jgi:hypothetical protein